jgi:hypothetical protein
MTLYRIARTNKQQMENKYHNNNRDLTKIETKAKHQIGRTQRKCT